MGSAGFLRGPGADGRGGGGESREERGAGAGPIRVQLLAAAGLLLPALRF